jgi:CheY-like chemotaxis protein
MLKKLGCTFVIKQNGLDALEALNAEAFDFVLMDQFIPVLDGPAATRRIRQMDGPLSRIPVIGMTASNLP